MISIFDMIGTVKLDKRKIIFEFGVLNVSKNHLQNMRSIAVLSKRRYSS